MTIQNYITFISNSDLNYKLRKNTSSELSYLWTEFQIYFKFRASARVTSKRCLNRSKSNRMREGICSTKMLRRAERGCLDGFKIKI